MSSRVVRRLVTGVLVGMCSAAVPAVAHADPAGPTDYRSTVVAITPDTDSITVTIEGGDSFVRLVVEPGHEVVVLGYADEPYLRFRPDGTVERNRRSYATYYNEERYGREDVPELVDNDAEPDWVAVGTDGTWAWHDHRAHWMGTEPPIGLEPGESLPDQVVPVVVDGEPVSIAVRITLVGGPSLVPVVFGALIGLGLGLLAALLGPASAGLVMLLSSLAALAVGGGQYWSLPAETGRMITWWLLPALAVAFLTVAIVTYGRSRLLQLSLTLLAALEVGLWALRRRAGLTKPVLPTDLPAGLDRFVTSASLAVTAVVAVVVLRELFRLGGPSESSS